MTLNGWLQILFFLLALALVTPLIGGYMARVFTRAAHLARPVLRPFERLVYRAHRRRRDAQRCGGPSTRWRCCSSASSRCWCCTRMQRLQAYLPFNPQGFGRRPAGPRVQHRRLVHDQHELAGVQRRDRP